jgi:ankyrin repeat protein
MMRFFLFLFCICGVVLGGSESNSFNPSTARAIEGFSSLLHHISDNVVTGSVLCNAAKEGDVETIQAAIERNMDVNLTNKNGDTALHWAARNNFIDIVILLVKNQAEVNIKNNKGFTSLHWSVAGGHLEIVEILLNNGADPNIKNIYDTTPLALAAKNGHDSIIQLLIQFKAEVVEQAPNDPLTY